jgi:hypothetical protein
LDGFPSTQRQAALLEKALRGQELHFGLDKPAYVSIVAPPPDSVCIFLWQDRILCYCKEFYVNIFYLRKFKAIRNMGGLYCIHIRYMIYRVQMGNLTLREFILDAG